MCLVVVSLSCNLLREGKLQLDVCYFKGYSLCAALALLDSRMQLAFSEEIIWQHRLTTIIYTVLCTSTP